MPKIYLAVEERAVFFVTVVLLLSLSSCAPAGDEDPSISQIPVTATPKMTVVPSPSPTQPATPTTSPTLQVSATRQPTRLVEPTETLQPSATATASATVSPTTVPTATAWPTPRNLPPAPKGWRWELQATAIPVTHYIVYEMSAADLDDQREQPYGLDDRPLPGIEPLPRRFLMETAYQGSGLLPNGDILQVAAVRAPVERDLVPFRFLIIPSERCNGHPIAGNGTCSVPFVTGATTWKEGEEAVVPVGSTIFIPELNMKIRINDVAISDGPPKIDLYSGTVNNYDYERPDGATIWILVDDS